MGTSAIDTGIIRVQKRDSLFNKTNRVLTSAFVLITSFILSNLFLQSMIAYISKYLNYEVIFSYNRVISLPRDVRRWSTLRVMAIYVATPIICLIFGFFLFNILIYILKLQPTRLYRLFIFWMMVCLVNIFFSHLIFAPLGTGEFYSGFFQTFAILASWLYVKPQAMVFFAIVSIIGSVLFGVLIFKEVMRFSYSGTLIKSSKGRNSVIMQVYLLPVFVSILPIMLLTKEPNIFPTMFMFAPLIIASVGMFVKGIDDKEPVKVNRDDSLNHFPLIELIICTGVWLAVFLYIR